MTTFPLSPDELEKVCLDNLGRLRSAWENPGHADTVFKGVLEADLYTSALHLLGVALGLLIAQADAGGHTVPERIDAMTADTIARIAELRKVTK